MRPEAFVENPVLSDASVILRAFDAGDSEPMAVILSDPEVARLTGSVHDSRTAHSLSAVPDPRLLDWYSTRSDQVERLDFAIVEKGTAAWSAR